ncbi:MAG: hypothetical protein ACM3UU_01735 [Ignavibacteriales bacterium]
MHDAKFNVLEHGCESGHGSGRQSKELESLAGKWGCRGGDYKRGTLGASFEKKAPKTLLRNT